MQYLRAPTAMNPIGTAIGQGMGGAIQNRWDAHLLQRDMENIRKWMGATRNPQASLSPGVEQMQSDLISGARAAMPTASVPPPRLSSFPGMNLPAEQMQPSLIPGATPTMPSGSALPPRLSSFPAMRSPAGQMFGLNNMMGAGGAMQAPMGLGNMDPFLLALLARRGVLQ